MSSYENIDIIIQGSADGASESIDKTIDKLKDLNLALNSSSKNNKLSGTLDSLSKSLNSLSGVSKLNDLSKALINLNNSGIGKLKVSSTIGNQLEKIANSTSGISEDNIIKIYTLSSAIKSLSEVSDIKISTSIGNQIRNITDALANAKVDDETLKRSVTLAQSLRQFSDIPKSSMGTVINHLKKIPEALKGLKEVDLDSVRAEIERLNEAMTPLGNTMRNVADGFNVMPKRLQSYITSMERATTTVKRSHKTHSSYFSLLRGGWLKVFAIYASVRKLSGFVSDSMEYVEAINLFDVAMGRASETAHKFVNEVQSVMGIDPSGWMKSQGTFKMIQSGFGIAEEQANLMSQQLTQLAYDASSFFNIPMEEAVLKFQSGIAGELEPVRRLGYALDRATLQQLAYRLEINKSYNEMSQAEKAMLRYYAMMTQNVQVQGDMARTLDSPANALRIFRQQLEQLSRAIGNLLIPIISKVLPWLQAFTEILTEAIHGLGALVGFEMPKFDYSGIQAPVTLPDPVEDVAEAFDNAGTNAQKALKATKEFSNYLLGFDQMHVIPSVSPASPYSGYGGGGGLPGGLDKIGGSGLFDNIRLPEYDFLKGAQRNIDEIKQKLRDLFDTIKELTPIIGGVLSGIGTILLGNSLANMLQKWLNVDPSLIRGLTLGVAGMIVSGLTSYLAWKDYAKGAGEGFATALIQSAAGVLVGTVGIAAMLKTVFGASTLVAGLGGFGIALGVALVGGIIGYLDGVRENIAEAVSNAFYDGIGTKLSDITEAYKRYVEVMFPVNQEIINNGNLLKDSEKIIDRNRETLNIYAEAWVDGGVSATEAREKMVTAMKEILTETETTLSIARDNIILALGGSFGEALEIAGYNISDLLELINKTKSETEQSIQAIRNELTDLDNKLETGTISDSDYANRVLDLSNKYAELTGSTTLTKDATYELMEMFDKINWESPESIQGFFDSMVGIVETAREGIDTEGEAIINSLIVYRDKMTDPENRLKMDEVIGVQKQSIEDAKRELDESVKTVFELAQIEITGRTEEFIAIGQEKWNKMSVFGKLFNTERSVIETAVKSFRDGDLAIFTTGMLGALDELGIEGTDKATGVINNILSSLSRATSTSGKDFDYNNEFGSLSGKSTYTFSLDDIKADMREELDTMRSDIKPLAELTGKSVPEGLGAGIDSAKSEIVNSAENMAETIIDTTKKSLDSHSPSRKMIPIGESIPQGLAKGMEKIDLIKEAGNGLGLNAINSIRASVDANRASVVGSFRGVATEIANIFNALFSGLSTAMNDTLRGLGEAGSSFSIQRNGSGGGSYGFKNANPGQIRMYAQGGYPDSGDLFIANESGPELVGRMGGKNAVVNNEQIAKGLADALYPAIYRAVRDGNKEAPTPGGEDIYVQIEGRTIAQVVRNENSRINKRNGKKVVQV